MIDLDEALEIVLQNVSDFGTEKIPLELSVGRVLKEDIYADRELPPYDRVTMDGIAVNYAGSKDIEWITIEGVAPAGEPQKVLQVPQNCWEVMTGAICPEGCDTVIRYEDLQIEEGKVKITTAYKEAANIHSKGLDRKAGDLLVPKNRRLSPAEIGVAAAVGKAQITVAKLPRVLIISTGDELVEIDQQPESHQIRRGNVYRIAAALKQWGLPVGLAHLQDSYEEILQKLSDYLQHFDALILSGGVSKGKFDYVPKVLEELGVKKHFHGVAQRPGKPFWFGSFQNKCRIFAFPGNPVSSFMCTQVYFREWFSCSVGLPRLKRPLAKLQADVNFKPDLDYFLEVQLSTNSEGALTAMPFKGHGSGDFANLIKGDAFLRLPRGRNTFNAGESFRVYGYRQF